jgi:hypothetical protein
MSVASASEASAVLGSRICAIGRMVTENGAPAPRYRALYQLSARYAANARTLDNGCRPSACGSRGGLTSGDELDGDSLGPDSHERHAAFDQFHVAIDFEFESDDSVGVKVFSAADQVSQRIFASKFDPIAADFGAPV